MKLVTRTQAEIDAVLNKASELADGGRNPFFGMTYAQGVEDGIKWLLGETNDNPMEDD